MKKGFNYLCYSLLAFGGVGLEVILAYVIEPMLFGAEMANWTTPQHIIHWVAICTLWGLCAWLLVRSSCKNLDFDVFAKGKKVAVWQWVLAALLVIFSLGVSYFDWNGIKVVKEFNANGALKFVFQYIYYCFEVALVTLILVFGQRAFEEWFQNDKIPYGGIILALTWGAGHFFTKDFSTGIVTMISGLAFGSMYLLMNRDIKKTYIFLWFMFVL